MLTIIPFSGFYDSLHDSALSDALTQSLADDSGNPYADLSESAWEYVDWKKVYADYANGYAAAFAEEFQIRGLLFKSLNSPCEYNFTTDRIFCTVPRAEMRRIRRVTPARVLADVAADMFTSRSGFISFYSNNPANWGAFDKWDHNQRYALIRAYVLHMREGGEFDIWAEYALIEDAQCNGALDNWIYGNCKPRLHRMSNVAYARRERGIAA